MNNAQENIIYWIQAFKFAKSGQICLVFEFAQFRKATTDYF